MVFFFHSQLCWDNANKDFVIHFFKNKKNVNDPSAGSPTETLLRLLLPLNDQVRISFRRPQES